MSERVRKFYETYDEDGRLLRDRAHMTEYLTTIRYFDRLFVQSSRILDACAGTGRYAFYLAGKGHIVTACDLVERNVDIIRAKLEAAKLAQIAVCDVLDLTRFEDSSFDAVLCMGALYHLQSDEQKLKAVLECIRVCKPGGIVVLAYVTKIGSILANLNDQVSNMDELIKILEGTDAGVFCRVTPQKVEEVALRCGLEKMHNIATDGMIYYVGEKLENATEESFQKYMEYHYATCEDESVIGASLHGLWIGRKSS